MQNFKFNKLKPIYRIKDILYSIYQKNTVLLFMVVIVIQNHCDGEYLEVITMFDYGFPSEYYCFQTCRG
jgi:hypothetical protein